MELTEADLAKIHDLDNFDPVIRIVVIGVGGAGSNAVNRMVEDEIPNIDFYVINTDRQHLAQSRAPHRIVIGDEITQGLGTGADPSKGQQAAEYSREEIANIVKGAHLVFIAAGMGKGTGTGASPVVAQIAKDAGALTLAIVTRPYSTEGGVRTKNAVEGLGKLQEAADAVIVVSNDKLLRTQGSLDADNAYAESDKILAQCVKTVSDMILTPGRINLDFADVRTTLQDSKVAVIGYGKGTGPNKVEQAVEEAINSSILETSIMGARKCCVNVTHGSGVTLHDIHDCYRLVKEQCGTDCDIKTGQTSNGLLEDTIVVSVIAADYDGAVDISQNPVVDEGFGSIGSNSFFGNNYKEFPKSEAPAPAEPVEEKPHASTSSNLADLLNPDWNGFK